MEYSSLNGDIVNSTRILLAAMLLCPWFAVSPATGAVELDPLGPIEPSVQEQLGIYEINLARHDPEAYGRRIGFDLTGVAPRPPLAVSLSLTGSARYHSLDMVVNGYFAHVSPWSGISANQMAVDHGYDLFGYGIGYDWGSENYIESLAYGYNMTPDFPSAIRGLIIDQGVPGAGHRLHLLGQHETFMAHREIGCGRQEAGLTRYYAVHTAYVRSSDLFLTGVVYRDLDGNGRYDGGEGIGGSLVTAGAYSAVSLGAGGFSIRVPPGDYDLTCSGGSFVGTSSAEVSVTDHNVEVDFVSGRPGALVDFAMVAPAALPVTLQSSVTSGSAPLLVDLSASVPGDEPAFLWKFPDGSTEAGPAVSRTFVECGLFPVLVAASSSEGEGAALALVSVDGPEGAGPGTAPPADVTLAVRRGTLRANYVYPGMDRATLVATLEMPAGFVPGEHPVEVSIGGVTMAFTLDALNRGIGAAGNKIRLKYRLPEDGGPLPAGVRATLTVALRGDCYEVLRALGLRNATGTGTLPAVPFAFRLRGQVWRGEAGMLVRGKEAKSSTAATPKVP